MEYNFNSIYFQSNGQLVIKRYCESLCEITAVIKLIYPVC